MKRVGRSRKIQGPFDPGTDYAFLSRNGSSAVFGGGEKFWSLPPEEIAKLGRGWLVSEFTCTEDWPNWEMHPEADELVYLLEGDVDLLVEESTGVRPVQVQGRGLVIIPRGT